MHHTIRWPTQWSWWPVGSVLLIFCMQSTASIAAPPIVCPSSIPQRSIQLTDPPPGWNAFVGSPLYLHNAAPMSGPPEQLGELSDFRQKRIKDGWIHTYRLDGKFPEGKWLACRYGGTGQLTLARRLDDSIEACTFTYRKGEHVGQHEIAILCR